MHRSVSRTSAKALAKLNRIVHSVRANAVAARSCGRLQLYGPLIQLRQPSSSSTIL